MRKHVLKAMAALVGLCGCIAATAADTPTGGVIMFAQKMENGEPAGQQCTLKIERNEREKVYNFRDGDTDCNNDVHSFFRVDNAPSAVIFELRSDAPGSGDECRSDEDTRWIFTLRTTRSPTSSGWISIPGLKGRPTPSIIDVGGVRLESIRNKGGNIEGKLSCVKINH